MKYSLLIILFVGSLLSSCQNEITCEDRLLSTISQNNFYADSTQSIISDCGSLDAVDIEITQTPFLTEIVDVKAFSSGKYDVKRFLNDFKIFSKTEKYRTIRTTLIMQSKTYDASDWHADKEHLMQKYSMSDADMEIFESVVKDPANSTMKYPDAYQEMNRIKLEKLMKEMEAKKAEIQ